LTVYKHIEAVYNTTDYF